MRRALDRYFFLLLMIVVTIGCLATIEPRGTGAIILAALQSITALVAVSTSDARPRTRALVRIVTAVAVIAVVIATFTGSVRVVHLTYDVLMLVLVAIVPVTIARRIFGHERITVQTVMGAVCIYLLIGLFFVVVAGAYQREAGAFFASGPATDPSDFVYFSYVTLATVGYGDLVPGPALARMIAVFEALMGQLYLVTVVAVLVANIGRQGHRNLGEPIGDPQAMPPSESDRNSETSV